MHILQLILILLSTNAKHSNHLVQPCEHNVTIDTIFFWSGYGVEPVIGKIYNEAFYVYSQANDESGLWIRKKGVAIQEYNDYMISKFKHGDCETVPMHISPLDPIYFISEKQQQKVHDSIYIGGNYVELPELNLQGYLTSDIIVYFKKDSDPHDIQPFQEKYKLLYGNVNTYNGQYYLSVNLKMYKATSIIEFSRLLRSEQIVESVQNSVSGKAFEPPLD